MELEDVKEKIIQYFETVDPDKLYEMAKKCGFKEKPTEKAMFIYFSEGYWDTESLIAVVTNNDFDVLHSVIDDCLTFHNIDFHTYDSVRIANELIEETEDIEFKGAKFRMSFELINQFMFNDYD